MKQENSYVLHTMICDEDIFVQRKLSGYVIALSQELGFQSIVHSFFQMPINPQSMINMSTKMNLVIMNADFYENAVCLCREFLSKNYSLPIIMVSGKTITLEPYLPFVGIIGMPVEREHFQNLFYRAIGQFLCERQIQKSGCLNLRIGGKKTVT